MAEVVITVYGTPAPQGSKRHVGNGVMVESSKAVKPWREAVKWAVLDALHAHLEPPSLGGAGLDPLAAPFEVDIRFYFQRPKGHYGTGKNAVFVKDSAPARPKGKPDVDKCARACLDALTDAGMWDDDSQVVTLLASKHYANPAAGLLPGAVIVVREVTA